MRAVCLTCLLLVLPLVSTSIRADSGNDTSELSRLLGSDDAGLFARAVQPRPFTFPADHGPHPEFRNEWWYFTGNLDGADGRRFGFELTIFRFALAPGDAVDDSNWRTHQLYIAHFAVTDVDGETFYVAERYSRGALGLAGARSEPFRVWIDNWSIRAGGAATGPGLPHWQLEAGDEAFALQLDLQALKPPVLNGDNGLSAKSDEPGNASYYYSMTRWQANGSIRIGDTRFEVSGLAWLDREWSSSALAADQVGWDWFALQLADDTELMFYNIRKVGGAQDRNSAGTWIHADGSTRYLDRRDVDVQVTANWQSPRGGRYPAGWRIVVPDLALELSVTPVLADQELSTTVRYWEGAVDVSGSRNGRNLDGRGYVELTGYAD